MNNTVARIHDGGRRLDPTIIQHEITNLLVQFPELAEDLLLRADMIEGATEAHEFLRLVEKKRQEACTMVGAIASNIAELDQRLGRFERREKAMRQLMFKILETADLKRVELPEATLSIRNGPQKVIITNDALIPEILCRIKREPDKTRIGKLLKDGNPVQGAELSNAEPTLSIRTK